MDISIIICTYNRSENLSDCFNCLENQLIDNTVKWEIVLVDNNSTDNTAAICENYFKQSTLNFHYVFESTQGLSAARNKGILEAKGTYLIFIDDDIRVTQNWLNSIYSTFNEFNCDAVGGRIHIESPLSLPRWITPDMYGFLGHQDFGNTQHPMDGKTEFPFGGNMAIHKRVIELIGNFDVNLGRKGAGLTKDELFKGEETDFFHRLANEGGTLYYQPEALVLHKILPHQLRIRFFLTLHNNAGLLQAKLDNSRYERRLHGIPLFLFPQLFRSILNYITASISKGINSSVRQLMTVFYFIGQLEGYYKKSDC